MSRRTKIPRRTPSSHSEFSRILAIGLASSIVLGLVFAWTPQFWGVSVVHVGVLLTACVWLYGAGSHTAQDIRLPLSAGFLAMVGLWGWIQVAPMGSVAIGSATPSFTRKLALEWTVAAVAFCLSSNVLHRSAARAVFLRILVWSTTVLSLLAILQLYSSPNAVFWIFPAQPLSVGTFLYKNQFAAMIELTIPVALYWMLFNIEKRAVGIFTFLALFAGAVASGSRAGASLVFVECIVVLFLAYRQAKIPFARIAILLPAVVIILGLTAAVVGNEYLWAHYQEAHHDAARNELFQSNLAMLKSAPWSGYGLGSWPSIYPKYATFDIGLIANAAHNDWMEWAIEGGIFFAGSLLAFVFATIRPAIQSVWGLGVIAIMLHSWVDYPTREPVLCILWMCLAGALLGRCGRAASEEKFSLADN